MREIQMCDAQGNCNGCRGCCDITTPITKDEFRILKRAFKKRHVMKIIKQLKKGDIEMFCPFSSDKGCEIYNFRPHICQVYHCHPDLKTLPALDFAVTNIIADILPDEFVDLVQRVLYKMPAEDRVYYQKFLINRRRKK